MCMALPACVKKTTHTVLVNESDNSIDLCKQTLIDDCIDERFDFSPSSDFHEKHLASSRYVQAHHKKQPTELSSLSISQAKLFDIPIPMQAVFNSEPIGDSMQGLSVDYSIMLDRLAITCFYEREMERLGWQQLIENSSNNEFMLVFDKPNKVCVVSIRMPKDSRASLRVVVTTGAKKMGHSFE